MWKELLKATDTYKAVSQEVRSFTISQTGSMWYVYANFETRPKAVVGRYKTYDGAQQSVKIIENITKCNVK